MRYVVKNKETGCFLTHAGLWSRYIKEAHQFPNGLSINLHLENAAIAQADKLQVLQLSNLE